MLGRLQVDRVEKARGYHASVSTLPARTHNAFCKLSSPRLAKAQDHHCTTPSNPLACFRTDCAMFSNLSSAVHKQCPLNPVLSSSRLNQNCKWRTWLLHSSCPWMHRLSAQPCSFGNVPLADVPLLSHHLHAPCWLLSERSTQCKYAQNSSSLFPQQHHPPERLQLRLQNKTL